MSVWLFAHNPSSLVFNPSSSIDKARELGCDEDEAAFEKRLRRIAKAPPAPEKKKPRRTGGT